MSWQDILNDAEFQAQPPDVKLRVAKNYFDKNFAVDPEFQRQGEEVRAKVYNNFINTVHTKRVPSSGTIPGAEKGVDPHFNPLYQLEKELRAGGEMGAPVKPQSTGFDWMTPDSGAPQGYDPFTEGVTKPGNGADILANAVNPSGTYDPFTNARPQPRSMAERGPVSIGTLKSSPETFLESLVPDFMKPSGVSPEEGARNANIMAISEYLGQRPDVVAANYDAITKKLGRGNLTPKEYLNALMTAGVAGGLYTAPLKTLAGIGAFMGAKEAESLGTQFIETLQGQNQEGPQPFAGREARELLGPMREPYSGAAELAEIAIPGMAAAKVAGPLYENLRLLFNQNRGMVVQSVSDMLNKGYTSEQILRNFPGGKAQEEAFRWMSENVQKMMDSGATREEVNAWVADLARRMKERPVDVKAEEKITPDRTQIEQKKDFTLQGEPYGTDFTITKPFEGPQGKGLPPGNEILGLPAGQGFETVGQPYGVGDQFVADLIAKLPKNLLPPGQGFELQGEAYNPANVALLRELAGQPLGLPWPSGYGEGFIHSEPRPKVIRRPGEPLYTEAREPEDVLTEYAANLSKTGTPYKKQVTAQRVLENKGLKETHEVVPVEGGFGIRKKSIKPPETVKQETPIPEQPPVEKAPEKGVVTAETGELKAKPEGKITIDETVLGKSSYGTSIYRDGKLIGDGTFTIGDDGIAKVGMIRAIGGRDTIAPTEWRNILSQLKTKYPQIKKFEGDRITRLPAGKAETSLPLPEIRKLPETGLSNDVKHLVLSNMKTELEQGFNYGMAEENMGEGWERRFIGSTNPSWLMEISKAVKDKHGQTVGKTEILSVINKEISGKGDSMTPKQLKVWYEVEKVLNRHANDPYYKRAEAEMQGAIEALSETFVPDESFGDLEFITDKEIEVAARNVVKGELQNENREILTGQAGRGKANRGENAPDVTAKEGRKEPAKTGEALQPIKPKEETGWLPGVKNEMNLTAQEGEIPVLNTEGKGQRNEALIDFRYEKIRKDQKAELAEIKRLVRKVRSSEELTPQERNELVRLMGEGWVAKRELKSGKTIRDVAREAMIEKYGLQQVAKWEAEQGKNLRLASETVSPEKAKFLKVSEKQTVTDINGKEVTLSPDEPYYRIERNNDGTVTLIDGKKITTTLKELKGIKGDFSNQQNIAAGGMSEYQRKITSTPEFKKWFKNSKVVDKDGNPLVVYSGHSNIEMYGNKYQPRKGTAGGFYASEDPQISSNYALGKFGGKEVYERGSQYRLAGKNGQLNKKIWQYELTDVQKQKLAELKAKDRELSDEGEPFHLNEMDRYIREMSPYDSQVRGWSYRGGSGNLQNIHDYYEMMGYNIAYPKEGNEPLALRQRKNDFEELLDALGIKWNAYDWAQPGVMPIYLSIQNPLDASKPFPPDLLKALKDAAKYKRRKVDYDAHWTDEYPLPQWVNDIESGSEYWSTQIPKEAKKIIQQFGYDGIKEIGLKGATPETERQVNWIAFEPEQIKSVFNRGTWDEKNPVMLYSDPFGIQAALKMIRGDAGEFAKVIDHKDLSTVRRLWNDPQFLAKREPEFKLRFDREMQRVEQRSIALTESLEECASVFNLKPVFKSSSKDLEALRDLIWKIEGKKIKAVESPAFIWDENGIAKLNEKHYAELRRFLDSKSSISPKVATAFVDLRKSLDHDLMNAYNIQAQMPEVDPGTIADLRKSMGMIHNYFPHHRYGNRYIRALDDKGHVLFRMHFNEIPGTQNRTTAMLKKYKPEYPDAKWETGKNQGLPDEIYDYPIPVEAMDQIIAAAADKMPSDMKETFESVMPKAVSDVMKSRGWGSHMIKRQNIPGYEKEDILGVLFDYKAGLYGTLEKLKASRDFSAMEPIDARKKPELYSYTNRYIKDVLRNMDKGDQVVDNARAFLYLYYIGGVIKTGTVNLTQNVIAGIPRLGMETRWAAPRYFKAAMDDILAAMQKKQNLSADEIRLLKELYEDGTTRDQMAREFKGKISGVGMKVMNKGVDVAGLTMSIPEKFNRNSLSLAAFRVARDGKITNKETLKKLGLKEGEKAPYDKAKEFAKEITNDSHFIYGRHNYPEWARGAEKSSKFFRLAYTLQSFTHKLLQLYEWMWTHGGKKAILKSMAGIAALGGLTSLPLAKTILHFYRKKTGNDPEKELREKMKDHSALRDVVTYGLPSLFDVNIGGSIGIELADPDNPIKSITGVTGSLIQNVARAGEAYKSGQKARALEELVPVVAKNPLAALRQYKEGTYTLSGQPINLPGEQGARKISGIEALAKSIGFQPLSSSKAYDAKKSLQDIREFVKEKQKVWANQYVNARLKEDDATADRIMEQVEKWNNKVMKEGRPELTISLKGGVKTRMKTQQPPKRMRGYGRELTEVYQ